MSKLIIIRGLPGSGKSTIAKLFTGFLHFEADQYFVDANGVYRYQANLIRQAHEECQKKHKGGTQ